MLSRFRVRSYTQVAEELESANLDLKSENEELRRKVHDLTNINLKLNTDLVETTELSEQLTLAVSDYEAAADLTKKKFGP